MPRKVFTSPKFNGGMILNADPSDLPEGFGVVALNTMVSVDSGSIQGRYADPAADGFDGVEQSAYVSNGIGATPTHVLAGIQADTKQFSTNGFDNGSFYGSLTCITGHRNYALAGRGKTALPLYYGYPNGQALAVGIANSFAPTKIAGSRVLTAVSDGPSTSTSQFDGESSYYYSACAVYDGYMYGPLQLITAFRAKGSETGYAPVRVAAVTLTHSFDAAEIKRVSSIKLFRAIGAPGLADALQTSEYVEVAEFKTFTEMVFTDTNDILIGKAYTAQSGLDETLKFCNIGYTVAHEMNNFLFVGNVGYVADIGDGRGSVQQLPEGSRMLYRSLRGKYCQFTVISDYLTLPFTPLAITSFNNRLIVFGAAEFAVVNPETMVLEDVVYGYGIESALCVHSAQVGVFFANKNNMYVYDGQKVTPIGEPIRRVADMMVEGFTSQLGCVAYEYIVGGIKKVMYSARINSVMFFYSQGIYTFAYVFSLDTRGWSCFSFGTLATTCSYIDRANNLYLGGVKIMSLWQKVSAWTYITKRYSLSGDHQWKKIYTIKSIGLQSSANMPISASFDSGNLSAIAGVDDGPFGLTHSVASGSRRTKNVMLKYAPVDDDGSVLMAVEITYREMLNTK